MGGGSEGIEETEFEKAQAEIALKRWGDYEDIYRPYENQYMREVDDVNSQANSQRATELAITPLAKTFAEEGMRIQRQQNTQGVNPNTGLSGAMRNKVATQQASAEVDTTSRTTSGLQDNYVRGLQNVVAMGQGQAGQAMSGLTDVAQRGQQNARSEAQDRLASRDNVRSGVGAAVGAGTSYALERAGNNDEP